MSKFEERSKAMENMYIMEEEQRFKISIAAAKELVTWAATELGYDETQTADYKRALVAGVLIEEGISALLKRLEDDLTRANNYYSLTDLQARFENAFQRHRAEMLAG